MDAALQTLQATCMTLVVTMGWHRDSQAAIPNVFLYYLEGHSAAGGGKTSLIPVCACAAMLCQRSAICDSMKAHLMEGAWNMGW